MELPALKPNAFVIEREMTITLEDFFRLLPKALEGRHFDIINNIIYVVLDNGQLILSPSNQSAKTIGSLVLPVIRVNFAFENCPEVTCRSFFKDFDLTYQKGGG